MFSGCLSVRPSVRPSEAWNNLFLPVHGSVGPSDQPWPFCGMSVCPLVVLNVEVLNVENQDDNHATFLDIEVDVEGDQFKTKTYDKRENYKFEIVNYPDLSGNIPHGAAYGVYTSQVIRYARVCNKADDLKERIKLLTSKLIKKGFTINRLKNTMKKCLRKHSWIAKKYKGLRIQNLYWCRKYQ